MDYISDKSCAEIDGILNRAVQRQVIYNGADHLGIVSLGTSDLDKLYVVEQPIKSLTLTLTPVANKVYGEMTIIFKVDDSKDAALNIQMKTGSKVNWANGEKPPLIKGCMYELSVSYIGITPDPESNLAGAYFNIVVVPFLPVE